MSKISYQYLKISLNFIRTRKGTNPLSVTNNCCLVSFWKDSILTLICCHDFVLIFYSNVYITISILCTLSWILNYFSRFLNENQQSFLVLLAHAQWFFKDHSKTAPIFTNFVTPDSRLEISRLFYRQKIVKNFEVLPTTREISSRVLV